MQLADLAAHRCNCMKRRVGCVIVREKRVISTGYNGTPRGMTNCNEGGCKFRLQSLKGPAANEDIQAQDATMLRKAGLTYRRASVCMQRRMPSWRPDETALARRRSCTATLVLVLPAASRSLRSV
jgi:hypothetical protein